MRKRELRLTPRSEEQEAAFARLVRDAADCSRRWLEPQIGTDEANEVLQIATLEMWAKLRETGIMPKPDKIRQHLLRIALLRSTDARRREVAREQHERTASIGLNAGPRGQMEQVLGHEAVAILRRELAAMDARTRYVFLEVRENDRKQADLAAELGVSARMIRNYLADATARLSKAFGRPIQ